MLRVTAFVVSIGYIETGPLCLWRVSPFALEMEKNMRKISAIFVLLLLVSLATVAVAADQQVKFNTPTVVNGQKLAPGEYRVQYDINGKTADIKLWKNNKPVADLTGQVVETNVVPTRDGVVRSANPDGTASISEIQMANKKQVIRINTDSAVGK